MKTSTFILLALAASASAEPILSSWYTGGSGRYARIWATQAQEATERGGGGTTSLTTWDSANYTGANVGDQPLPVYAGVQGISHSSNYVYIKATGLATNTMGPWFLNAARTPSFPPSQGMQRSSTAFHGPPATARPTRTTHAPPPAASSSSAFDTI